MALYREPLAGRLMGGLAGIVHWDTRPIDAAELESMIRASAHRGSDGVHTRLGARVALAHLLFITTPAQAADHPIADALRGLFFVFDGRLDNREELAAVLEMRDRDVPDARLAFEAFARWGTDTASHLLGDFAFVGWDDRRRRLVCARDHMGIRHLHYCATDDRVICATDLAQVLAHPAVRKVPDPSIAADYLAIDVRNGPETLYSGVRRVPAGHTLIGENGRVRLHQYWSAEPRGLVRYARDEEYAEHCRELLTRSVAARMRSDRPIAAMLSGGLDSSSVFSVAHRLVNDPGPPRR